MEKKSKYSNFPLKAFTTATIWSEATCTKFTTSNATASAAKATTTTKATSAAILEAATYAIAAATEAAFTLR